MNEAQLIKRLESQMNTIQQSLDKFMVDFHSDPSHALSWGNSTFQAAASLKVLKMVHAALTHSTPCSIQAVKETLMDRVLHKSKYPPQSTSPTSNLIEQYELAAYAELLSDLRYYEGE